MRQLKELLCLPTSLYEPPYTNSPLPGVTGGDEKVRKDVKPLFCASKCSIALISAHAHGYERFEDSDCEGR